MPDYSVLDKDFFAPLYDFFEDAGMSLLLSTPDEYYLLYFDIPEAIEDITPHNVSWLLEKETEKTALTMFADGKNIQTYHTFYFAHNPINTYFFKTLRDTQSITINLFTLQYGDIYKIKSITYKLPQPIVNQLE